MSVANPKYWPSARHFSEAMQFPSACFSNPLLRETLPAVDRLGMPLVTSGQFAYVYKLKPTLGGRAFAVRCFRGYLGDREPRYRAIHAHLQSQRAPALASFTYEPEGIFVEGRRFPILFMEWIEGPTLDVYLDEVVGKKEILLHLAGEWVRLVKSLREARIAHGDLQHGNIIVERGNLRLVDLDGMFVPEMKGWLSSEVGHQHFQHPARDERLFDLDLDNFSALVIYLSLISLAEEPSLWAQHHDENLLFTRADFIDPDSSALFGKIKEIGPEHRRLADVLEAATKSEPTAVPCLPDLVAVQSRLPSWMTAPLNLEVAGKTREAPRLEAPAAVMTGGPQRRPAAAAQRARHVPSTPGSATVQSLFSEPLPGQPVGVTTAGAPRDPTQIGKNTIAHAKDLLRRTFLWWYWSIYLGLKIAGLEFFYSLSLAVVFVAVVCLTYGFFRAWQEAQAAAVGPTLQPLFPPSSAPTYLPSWYSRNAPVAAAPASSSPLPSASALDSIIGSRTLGIYHLPGCAWAQSIPQTNQVGFSSPTEATMAGYQPCHVCLP